MPEARPGMRCRLSHRRYLAGLSAGAAGVVVDFDFFFFDLCVEDFLVVPLVVGFVLSAATGFDASDLAAALGVSAAFIGSAGFAAGVVPWAYAVVANAKAHRAVRSLFMAGFLFLRIMGRQRVLLPCRRQ